MRRLHYRRLSIRSHYSAQSEVAIAQCNYFRRNSVAATFVVDATATVAAAGAGFELVEVDESSGVASGAFVDSD